MLQSSHCYHINKARFMHWFWVKILCIWGTNLCFWVQVRNKSAGPRSCCYLIWQMQKRGDWGEIQMSSSEPGRIRSWRQEQKKAESRYFRTSYSRAQASNHQKGCPRDQSLSYIKTSTLRKKARRLDISFSRQHHTLLAPYFSYFKLVSLAAHLEMGWLLAIDVVLIVLLLCNTAFVKVKKQYLLCFV